MKLNSGALERRLRQSLDPVYFICGDEPFLAGVAADRVREAARGHGYTEREVYHAAARGFDWDALAATGAAMSLFADKRLVEVRLPTGKPGDAGSKAFVAWCQDPPPDTVLLVVAGKLDGGQKRAKWVKALDEAGVMVEVWPLTPGELPKWLAQRMREHGLQPHPEAVEILAERVEGNLLAAAQEIDKLALLAGEGPVDADMVRASVADSARYDVFKLVDEALSGNAARAVHMLDGLRAEGEAPPLITWALVRELRTLSMLSGAVERGDGLDRALHAARVWDRRKPLFQGALERLNPARVARLLQRAAKTERVVKGAERGNVWDELTGLTMMIAGRPARVRA